MSSHFVPDLNTCDKERVHIPQAIQPHGLYLVVCEQTHSITAISDTCARILGQPAHSVLGQSVYEALGAGNKATLEAMLQGRRDRAEQARTITLNVDGVATVWEATTHYDHGRLAVELEPTHAQALSLEDINLFHHRAIDQLRGTYDLTSLCTRAAQLVREITQYDRVVVYRFDHEGHGVVVAENKSDHVSPFLGLHFPASDIPQQARAMYARNRLRAIPDVHYRPSAIITARAADPIDLTQAILRSVSPVHREYMRNMGIDASMSVSLMYQDRLWGLISCSHEHGPHALPFSIRATCETVGAITAMLIESKERNEDSEYKLQLKVQQSLLLQRITQAPIFTEALATGTPSVLDVANATGAAIFFNDELTLTGITPTHEQVKDLLGWLQTQSGPFLETDTLPTLYAPAMQYKDVGCGLIAAAISRARNSYILWFRQEVLQMIKWGGDPSLAKTYNPETMRMHPRNSFAAYKQLVHLTCLPWKEAETSAAGELIQSISDIVLQKAEELQRVNNELERSNLELDAFAYAASHDLKEPLRGIHNYTELAIEELTPDHLVGQTAQRLQTVVKLTRRMEDLINSLLHYSHVGRTQLAMQDVDLNRVVTHVREMTDQRLSLANTHVRLPNTLPVVRGDPVLIGELFANLVTNGIKYNNKKEPWLEITAKDATNDTAQIFCVRDNGIGIAEKNLTAVFKIFRRLHGRNAFGGGTGTGLTIAQRIVERHGGRMWVESELNEGSSFYFTLTAEPGYA